MFKKFSFKLRINVICIVCLMLAIQFILTYILFFSIFTDDFKQKSNELSSQISNHVTLRLQYVEEATRLFCSEYDVHGALSVFDSTMSTNLGSLSAATNDIRGCVLLGEELSYYYSSAYGRNLGQLLDFVMPHFDRTGKSGYWCIYKPEAPGAQSFLLFSYVIRDESQIPTGVLIVDVSLEDLYNTAKIFDTDLMAYTTVYISSTPDGQKLFFHEPGREGSSEKDSESQIKKYQYAEDISINTVSSVRYIHEKLRFILVLMITIFAIALMLLFVVLYIYSRHLTKRMTDLAYKMNNFIERD